MTLDYFPSNADCKSNPEDVQKQQRESSTHKWSRELDALHESSRTLQTHSTSESSSKEHSEEGGGVASLSSNSSSSSSSSSSNQEDDSVILVDTNSPQEHTQEELPLLTNPKIPTVSAWNWNAIASDSAAPIPKTTTTLQVHWDAQDQILFDDIHKISNTVQQLFNTSKEQTEKPSLQKSTRQRPTDPWLASRSVQNFESLLKEISSLRRDEELPSIAEEPETKEPTEEELLLYTKEEEPTTLQQPRDDSSKRDHAIEATAPKNEKEKVANRSRFDDTLSQVLASRAEFEQLTHRYQPQSQQQPQDEETNPGPLLLKPDTTTTADEEQQGDMLEMLHSLQDGSSSSDTGHGEECLQEILGYLDISETASTDGNSSRNGEDDDDSEQQVKEAYQALAGLESSFRNFIYLRKRDLDRKQAQSDAAPEPSKKQTPKPSNNSKTAAALVTTKDSKTIQPKEEQLPARLDHTMPTITEEALLESSVKNDGGSMLDYSTDSSDSSSVGAHQGDPVLQRFDQYDGSFCISASNIFGGSRRFDIPSGANDDDDDEESQNDYGHVDLETGKKTNDETSCRWIWWVAVFLLVLLVTAAVGLAIHRNNQETNVVVPTEPTVDKCASFNRTDYLDQCRCVGSISHVDDSILPRYDRVSDVLRFYGALDHPAMNESLTSCSPSSLTRLILSELNVPVTTLLETYIVGYLYFAFGGYDWTTEENWFRDPNVCEWQNVGCDVFGTVRSLSLGNNNLRGTIPTELGLMTDLRELELQNNALTGVVDGFLLNSLDELRTLDLSGNQFGGNFGDAIPQSYLLGTLRMSNNDFTGSIPFHIGSMAHLRELDIGQNQLTGTLPTNLGRLFDLESLDFSHCQFTGTLPTEYQYLEDLESFTVQGNPLTGTVPDEYNNMDQLEVLDISDTRIVGPIPSSMCELVRLEAIVGDCEGAFAPVTDCPCCVCSETGEPALP